MENVIIKRGYVTTLDKLPSYSIALDGYVQGPVCDEDNHRWSFDHHGNCLRYCTQATCVQAWTAIMLGLEDIDRYTVYCNDIDIDVCAAIWCLKNPDRCMEPLVKKLIDAIGIGDMHGGAISCNGMTKVIEWICEPETGSRRHNDYHKISNEGLQSILEAILYRIDQYVDGEATVECSKHPKHGEYKILRNENDWVMVESADPHVSSALFQAGFCRIVIVRPQSDDSYCVTLAKKSDFISGFPILDFYDQLNIKEQSLYKRLSENEKPRYVLDNLWGGSSRIGGSPRNSDGSRSHLSLEDIAQTIDEIIQRKYR